LKDIRDHQDIATRRYCNNFYLKKWAFNSKDLLEDIPSSEAYESIHFNEHEEIYTLGMQWNIADNAF